MTQNWKAHTYLRHRWNTRNSAILQLQESLGTPSGGMTHVPPELVEVTASASRRKGRDPCKAGAHPEHITHGSKLTVYIAGLMLTQRVELDVVDPAAVVLQRGDASQQHHPDTA